MNEENNNPSLDEILKRAAETLGILGESPSIVKEDDEFQFECQQCGACCTNRNDIILNAFDIYNIASYLKISCPDFIQKYTKRDLGGSSKMPLVTIAMDDETESCPFLKFDYMNDGKYKCTIHPVKPGACQCHPLGIMSECEFDDNGEVSSSDFHFIKVDQCPQSKTGESHKVKDWMKNYLDHREESTKAHQLSIMTNSIVNWRRLFIIVGILTVSAESKGVSTSNDLIARSYNTLANLFIQRCYAAYDTSKPFLPQCEENYEFVKDKFNVFAQTILPSIELLFNDVCEMTIDEIMDSMEDNEKYLNDNGDVVLERAILDIGRNHCNYEGLTLDIMEEFEGDDKFDDE